MRSSAETATGVANWRTLSLGDLCRFGGGSIQTGPFGSQLHAEDYKTDGIPIITVEHLKEGRIAHENLPLVGPADYERLNRYVLANGDLVFSRVDSVGSTMACLNTKILSGVPIDLPPAEEQRRIAAILSILDETIGHTEALIVKHQQIKAGLMHDLFTRGVTPGGHLRPTPTDAPGLYKETFLGLIPRSWQINTAEAVAESLIPNPQSKLGAKLPTSPCSGCLSATPPADLQTRQLTIEHRRPIQRVRSLPTRPRPDPLPQASDPVPFGSRSTRDIAQSIPEPLVGHPHLERMPISPTRIKWLRGDVSARQRLSSRNRAGNVAIPADILHAKFQKHPTRFKETVHLISR